MAGPIANARHATPSPRRRNGSSNLFRCVVLGAIAVVLAGCTSTVVTHASGSGSIATQVPAAGVQAGACMSFAPVGGVGDKTVFIDPGHGGLDPGVVANNAGKPLLEKDVTLAVSNRLEALLRTAGYRVVMSRVTDSSVGTSAASEVVAGALTASAVHQDLVARAACANAARASVLLSVHFNAFDDPSVGGTETYYDPARPFAGKSKRLATDLQAAMVSALGSDNRGVFTDDRLGAPALTPSGSEYGHLIELGPGEAGYMDSPSMMPGALVEPLFLTNPLEVQYAASAAGKDRIASALLAGLENYFSG